MLGPLRDWARAGGILVGTSAGAIILTPTIAVDALFTGGRPEDMVDAEALGLVPFEFFPHFDDTSAQGDALLRHSRTSDRPIIACRDGEGLIVTGGAVQCFGKPVWISGGRSAGDAQSRLDDLLKP